MSMDTQEYHGGLYNLLQVFVLHCTPKDYTQKWEMEILNCKKSKSYIDSWLHLNNSKNFWNNFSFLQLASS